MFGRGETMLGAWGDYIEAWGDCVGVWGDYVRVWGDYKKFFVQMGSRVRKKNKLALNHAHIKIDLYRMYTQYSSLDFDQRKAA